MYLKDLYNERSTNYNLQNLCGKLTLAKPRTNYSKPSFSYSAAQVILRLVYTSDGIGIGIGIGIKSGRNLTVTCKSRNVVISGSRRVTESELEELEGFLFIRIPFRFSRLQSLISTLLKEIHGGLFDDGRKVG